MRTGDLIATAEPGFVSRMIRRVTRSKVSHVAGVIELNEGGERRLYVIEAHRKTGVALVALSVWIGKCRGRVWWWPECIDTQHGRKLYASEVMSHLGEPYESDKWMLTRVALGLRPPANKRWFCSELDIAGRRAAGVDTSTAEKHRWPECCVRLYGGIDRAEGISK
jgi:hypothetical protein